MKGVALPPVIVDLTIRPPQSPVNREMPSSLAPVEPTFPFTPRPKEPAPRLLTLPPFPIEQIGAEALLPDLAGMVATNYVPTSALTVRPKPTREPVIQLPPGWLEAFGLARLTLYVSAAGKVDAVILIQTDLPPALHDAVRDAFHQIAFSPGELNGRAVPVVMTIETNIALLLGGRR